MQGEVAPRLLGMATLDLETYCNNAKGTVRENLDPDRCTEQRHSLIAKTRYAGI